MRIAKRVGIFIVLAFLLISVGQPVDAAQNAAGTQWFPETGFYLRGEFYKFYYSVKDPLTLFGYPIADESVDSTGTLTQYFQRARFDLTITKKGPVVTLANLGSFVYDGNGIPSSIPQTGPTCRLFPRTGKTVCYAFLQYYDANQGETYFGDPVSALENRDGVLVQYFQKVRMEWQPARPEGRKVVLTQLGYLAYYVINGSPAGTNGTNYISSTRPVTSLKTRAFVHDSLIGSGATQIVYLIVQSQDLQPVSRVVASGIVTNPDGSKYAFSAYGATGADGVLKILLPVGDHLPGELISVEITASFQGLQSKTNTWFRIWY
jgi:hypothetical protein